MKELFLAAVCLPVVFSTHAYGLFKMLAKISLIWVYSCCSADAMDCCIMIAESGSVESALGGLIKTVLNCTLRECSAWCFELNEEGAVSGAS